MTHSSTEQFYFDFYSDELPVQLTLPRSFREAQNRQQLSSLALLGQEFWRYPMANPRSATTPTTANTSPTPKTESSGIGTTVFSSSLHQKIVMTPVAATPTTTTIVNGQMFSPSTPSMVGIQSLAGTPSDTASSLSSFTSIGHQMMSPESADNVMLSPIDASRTGIVGKTSTFKVQNRKSLDIERLAPFNGNGFSASENGNIRPMRPTPPSTLNLTGLRIPPAPPKRWTKPSAPSSPNEVATDENEINNFTVTTTVTVSVDKSNQNAQQTNGDLLTPNNNQTVSKTHLINEL